jgi:hypothetical protein
MIAAPLSLVTLALVVGFAAIAGSLAFALTRSYELWRTSHEFFRALGQANDALTASLERLSAFEPRGLDRLSTATERLEVSRARLGILTGAIGRVRGQWVGLLGVYPRK